MDKLVTPDSESYQATINGLLESIWRLEEFIVSNIDPTSLTDEADCDVFDQAKKSFDRGGSLRPYRLEKVVRH